MIRPIWLSSTTAIRMSVPSMKSSASLIGSPSLSKESFRKIRPSSILNLSGVSSFFCEGSFNDKISASRAQASFLDRGFERPLAIIIGQTVPIAILNTIDNDSTFVSVVRVRTHSTHGLLNKKCKRHGRTSENDSLTIRHVETFAEKLGIAQDFNFVMSEVVDDL